MSICPDSHTSRGKRVLSSVPASKVLKDPVLFAAFGFGTGLAPFAPGTVGSLPAFVLAWFTLELSLELRVLVLIALILAGIWICGEAARRIGVHDHPGIVWDEIAGQYMVLLVAPVSVFAWALSFGLFRLFDIWKPWPIRDLDHRLGGGTGIMLDDLVAALYAALILAFYRWQMV
jgi:phosphatidylglycerophosphatase A